METRKRGYLRYGFSCSGGYAPLFKKVMAMPEDFVQVKKQAITINKKEIPNTARLDFGRKWQALPSLVATETVPFGRLCVLSDYSKQS
ncbi:MAG: S26 family signal peptidase [Pseudomonadota bacterium]